MMMMKTKRDNKNHRERKDCFPKMRMMKKKKKKGEQKCNWVQLTSLEHTSRTSTKKDWTTSLTHTE